MVRGPGADRAQRIANLTDAAVNVLEREGPTGLTFRTVATEAGVSAGRVQYYFESSKGLALATFQRVQELITEEIRTSLISEGPASPKQIIRATVRGLIPATKSQQRLLRVAYVIESNALRDDELSMTLRTGKSSLIDFLAQQIKALDSSACLEAEDARAKAVSLLAMADGLSSLCLSELVSAEQARHLLDLQIGDL